MKNIKDLTDFYMWMDENDYGHNIRSRVEKKAEMYLKTLNKGQSLPMPPDDEILQVANDEMQQDWNRLEYKNVYRDGFIEGAKWMRDRTGKV